MKTMIQETSPPQDTSRPEDDPQDTKERLILAGMEVFAERGFADASIRQICARAEANPAAVNYHFGDKQRFYAEVLATCHLRAARRRPMPRLGDDPEHPEAVLGAFVRWFLELLLAEGVGPLGKLMAREMADPTSAVDEVMRRSLLPILKGLEEIVESLLPELDRTRRRLVLQSIMGQCLFYRHTQACMARFQAMAAAGELKMDLPIVPAEGGGIDSEHLAAHITEFSLSGIRALRDEETSP